MSRARAAAVFVAATFPLTLVSSLEACKHITDDEETKSRSAAPLSTALPFPSENEKESGDSDASVDASIDATTTPLDAKPDARPSSNASSSCCSGLRQSVTTAPPQIQGAYLMAAAACDVMSKNGPLEIARLRGMLLGAPLPASCK